MAEEGATFYYASKQHFDFEKSYEYLKNTGFSLKHTDSNFKIIQGADGEYTKKEIKSIRNAIYRDENSGVDLFWNSKHHTFWSFVENSNYFLDNFTFKYFCDIQTEERMCEIFISLAIKQISQIGTQFLGFTLDMYGETEEYDFGEILCGTDADALTPNYISDFTFLPKEKASQFISDKAVEIITVDRNFVCIAKSEKLAIFLKKALEIN